jgi:hypothetical protein
LAQGNNCIFFHGVSLSSENWRRQSTPGYAAFILHHQDSAIALEDTLRTTILATLVDGFNISFDWEEGNPGDPVMLKISPGTDPVDHSTYLKIIVVSQPIVTPPAAKS